MMYPSMRHPKRAVWDFWYYFESKTGLFHVFYLNADEDLCPYDKHHHASQVGYGQTYDFIRMDWICDNVLVANSNSWYNTCIWTGDVIQVENGFLMFFTSRDSRCDDGETQNVGVAFAPTLDSPWIVQEQIQIQSQQETDRSETLANPHPMLLQPNLTQLGFNPFLFLSRATEQVYVQKKILGDLTTHAWRDPFLFCIGERVCMLISAKSKKLPLGKNGCIALLEMVNDSTFSNWLLFEPITQSGFYSEMEVPQLYKDPQGRYELVFSSWAKYDFSPTTRKAGGLQGLTFCDGPKHPNPAFHVWMPEEHGLYACRVIPELNGEIIGFDISKRGIRRSGVTTNLKYTNGALRDFSHLSFKAEHSVVHSR